MDEDAINKLIDAKLVNAYAYSNLERAILTALLTEKIMQADDRQKALQDFYSDIRAHLYHAEYETNDHQTEQVRHASLKLASRFFQDVESRLLRARIIPERKLVRLD